MTVLEAVTTRDGVRLNVEITGGYDAPVTVVLSHGWLCSTRTWHHQLGGLPDLLGDRVRVLAYDFRGHGASGPAPAGSTTIDQLADDTLEVLEAVAPDGPLVFAGHSMGGMVAMALADREPELVRERFAGLVLIGTSAGQVTSRPFGLPARLDRFAALVAAPVLAAAGRNADRRLGNKRLNLPSLPRPTVRRFAFGKQADPDEVAVLADDVARTPGLSLTGFFGAIADHDRSTALAALDGVPVEVMHGTRDRLISPRHGNRLAASIPGARLWMYPGAGHMLMQERPRDVNHRLAALARKALRDIDDG